MEWHLRILLRKNVQILKKVFNRKGIMQKRVSFGVKIVTIWQSDFKSPQIIVFGAKIVMKVLVNFKEK